MDEPERRDDGVADPEVAIEDQRSRRFHERACGTFPGGVSHTTRYTDPNPLYMESATGAHVRDADGNEYVDFWMNHFASVLGHSHPNVVEAVTAQARNGLHLETVNERALELGERIPEYVPSAERVRLCVSGTEATMYAVRLARAYTGRRHVLKVEGGWHGGNTDLSVDVHAPFDGPETDGLPPGAAEHVHSFPYNDSSALRRLLDEYEGDVAAVVVEPLRGALCVEAAEPFLRALRGETAERDVVLVFDEVVTGFRVSPRSYQARIGVSPDLTTLGKFLGGGLPVGAIAGRADLFWNARPGVPKPQKVLAGGGTGSMHPLTAAAGVASLDVLDREPVHEHTETLGERVRQGLEEVFEDLAVAATVLGTSSLFCPHFSPSGSPDTIRAVQTETDPEVLETFHRRLLEHGYFFMPGLTGAISYRTTADHVDEFLAAAKEVTADVKAENVI
jgi:glutamate-1-semialdehyde 2,1-aminomutase